jgi:V8-like Glu-specific endopeptidase
MKRTLTLTAAGLLVVASAVLLGLTTPATGASGTVHPKGPVSHATGVDSRAEQDSVRAFWTKDRLKAAKPRGLERPTGKKPGGGSPGTTSSSNLGTAWTAGRVTVGKVFFQMGGSLYVCSGNAVDDAHDTVTTPNLVVTAGHCVSDGGDAWATKFMFIPSYDPTKPRTSGQPDGTFTATKLTTTPQWIAQGPDMYNYDVGMALVGTNEEIQGYQTLAAAIGDTSDIAFVSGDPTSTADVDYTVNTHAFGYPAARPYDGTRLISCWGTTTVDTVGGSTDYRLPCNMTGGSSGGPWLLDSTSAVAPLTENADVSDVQISVNSFGYSGEKNAMYGPIFGTTVRDLYTATATGD